MSERTEAAARLVTANPIRLGTILFTLVDPHRGHEVAYNRWYERDHFYAGCMVGPFNFAGRRFVATHDLKALRHPERSEVTGARESGSYLSLYWVQEGHHREWNRWAVDQVNLLHRSGRMFAERDHVHTLLYRYRWAVGKHADGVPAELALDHPYAGLVTTFADATGPFDTVEERLREQWTPSVLGDEADLCLTFTPLPLLVDAPSDVPRADANDSRFLQLWFLTADPRTGWEQRFAGLADRLAATGLASLLWAAPFVPTVPGTDTYADRLW